MLKSKRFISLLLLIILVLTVAGCSSQTKEEDGEVETLTLGTWGVSDAMTQAVEEYNKSQSDYTIEIKDYAKYDNYESDNPEDFVKGKTKLNMDIASGNMPDIINTVGIDRTYFAKNDGFANIYDLMKSDKDFSKDSILPNYLTANEVDNGLYWLSPDFFVDTLFANKDLSKGLQNWSTEEFVDIANSLNEDKIEIMGGQDPVHFMTFIGAGNQFLNEATESVHYDEPVFKKALEFSKRINPSKGYTEDDGDWEKWVNEVDAKKYQNGERLLTRGELRSFNDYLGYQALFGEEPVTMIGYPTLDGSSGHYFGQGLDVYAISSSSSAPEAAWDFIKVALNTDVETDQHQGFPIMMDRLEENLQKSITEYTDGSYSNDGVNLHIDKPTEEDLDEFMKFLKSIDVFANYGDTSEIYGLYDDFYAGTKTSSEVAQILQDKYELYFKENK